MAMAQHLNIFIPDDLMEALDAFAADCGLNRSQAARLGLSWFVVVRRPSYEAPTLQNWQEEAWALLLRSLFGDERLVLTDEIKVLLMEAVDRLNKREQQVLRLRFGLDGPRHTLEEAGAIFGIKRERTRQVEARALKQLQHWLRASGVWELLGEQLDGGHNEHYSDNNLRQ